MVGVVRVLEREQGSQDDDLEALAIVDVEPALVRARLLDSECGSPVEVVVQDLDGRGLDPPGWFFGHCDQYGRVRLPQDEALFSSPFELVSALVSLGLHARMQQRTLPIEISI